MEKPKRKVKKQSEQVEERPEYKIELEHNPEPLKGEAFEDWLRRIGGPFVKIESLKKCPKCGGTIFEEKEHSCKPTDKQRAEMPLIIDKNATLIVNEENIENYFDKQKIEEGLKSELEEWQNNARFIKKRDEYQLKKELFDTPAEYLNILTKELKGENGKIVADRKFGQSLEKWIKASQEKLRTEKKKPAVGDEVMWESQGTFQWKQPKKVIAIHEHKGQEFAFFKNSTTGIPLEQLKLIKEIKSKDKDSMPDKQIKQEKKVQQKKKPKKESRKSKKSEAPKRSEKTLTLDEQIEQKEKELEKVEIDYNVYYSPRVETLFGLASKFRRKNLKKELKQLKEESKKEKTKPKAESEKEIGVKGYLKHIHETDNLFTEMTKARGKVKKGELTESEYEAKKDQWRNAYNKTIEMEAGFSEQEIEKIIDKREKERKKSKVTEEIKKKWKDLWNLISDKFGKNTVEEVTKDAIEEQLKVIDKKLNNVSEQIKQVEIIDRAKLEKKERGLEKEKKRLKKLKKKLK